MRWLHVVALGFAAAVAILALVCIQNAIDHWHSHREVYLGEIAALERDPGYPNRDTNLRSAREQVDILDRIALKKSGIGALALLLAVAAFVPLWRRASGVFRRARLVVYVALGAAVGVAIPLVALVILSAGAISG